MKKEHKFSIGYVFVALCLVLIIQSYISSMFAIETIPYSQFMSLLKKGDILEVAITQNQIVGKMRVEGKEKMFRTVRVDPELIVNEG